MRSRGEIDAAGGLVRPRIVLVIGGLQAGGAERQLADLANYWATHDCAVTLATWTGPENADFYDLAPGIRRIHLEGGPPASSALGRVRRLGAQVRALRRLLRTSSPDAVLSFIDVSNVLTIVAALGLGLRVGVSERTSPAVNRNVTGVWRLLRKGFYRCASIVIAQTRDAASWLDRTCAVRAVVIPNALRNLPVIRQPRETLIIAVGRLSHEKGFDLLLRAFHRLQHEFPDWRVAILGEGPDRQRLSELCDELGLASRVSVAGEVRDVEAWMARAGLLVHPSRREGFPNAVLEAMGMGVAVICADCHSGPADLIQDGVNGRLVPVDDLQALTEAMRQLMASPDLRDRLGREATQVREGYAQPRILGLWEAALFPDQLRSDVRSRALH